MTRITVSSASVLLLVSDSSVSALTLDSRVATGRDAGSMLHWGFEQRKLTVECMRKKVFALSICAFKFTVSENENVYCMRKFLAVSFMLFRC